jgi:hypothetical protein
MTSNTCEMRVGRLMEIRVDAGYQSVRDVERMIGMMQSVIGVLSAGERFTVAADWRKVGVMSPETAARAREMLMRVNPRVVRSAILTLPDRSLASLQVVRLVREAELENRRHFTSPGQQWRWLGETLTPAERTRLAEFLGVDERSPPSEIPLVPMSRRPIRQ